MYLSFVGYMISFSNLKESIRNLSYNIFTSLIDLSVLMIIILTQFGPK